MPKNEYSKTEFYFEPVKGLSADDSSKANNPSNPKVMHESISFDEKYKDFLRVQNEEKQQNNRLKRNFSDSDILDVKSRTFEVRRVLFPFKDKYQETRRVPR